jgi:hypothetical protein
MNENELVENELRSSRVVFSRRHVNAGSHERNPPYRRYA